jgi:hypothetical protein
MICRGKTSVDRQKPGGPGPPFWTLSVRVPRQRSSAAALPVSFVAVVFISRFSLVR